VIKEEPAYTSLENLMRLAQKGDKAAYARFFQEVTPLIRHFIMRRLQFKSDVDDVLQTILLSIHRSTHTYDTSRPIKLWLFAIARYRLADYLKSFYRHGGFKQICIDDMKSEIPVADVTNEEHLSEYLNAALQSLPDKQNKIVRMMKLEGHSIEETAKAMDMTPGAVKVAAHRAYKVLALKLEANRETE